MIRPVSRRTFFHSFCLLLCVAVSLAGLVSAQAGAPAAGKSLVPAQKTSVQKPADTAQAAPRVDALHDLDSALQRLTEKVSPAVVEVLVSSFGPVGVRERTSAAVLGKQRSLGSGVILDPTGYIMTNAHVVEGAQRVLIVLPRASSALATAFRQSGPAQTYDAKIIGVDTDFDLALLKIDAKDLPSSRSPTSAACARDRSPSPSAAPRASRIPSPWALSARSRASPIRTAP